MKKILALLLAVLMIVGLAACGGGKTDPTTGANPTNGDSKDPTTNNDPATVTEFTIKVWAPTEDLQEGNSWIEAVEKKFEEAHPEYKITWENAVMDEGSAAGAVTTDVSASADVYMFANDQLGGLITAGGLSQLGGSFEAQVKNDNPEFHINTVTHTDGGIYAFPLTNNTWFTYYNKDVFSADDVKSLDTMLSKGKVCVPLMNSWTSGCFFLGTGCTVFGATGNDASAGIDFGGQKAYTAAKKMIEIAGNANCVAGAMEAGKLIDGEVAAMFSGSWSRAELENALGDKLGVAALPTFEADGNTYNMTALAGSKAVGVNPNSGSVKGKQKACTQFAAFMASEEMQLLRYEMRGVIPCHKNLANNDKIKNDPVAVAELETINKFAVVQSALPEMSKYWSPVETFGKGCVNGDVNMNNYQDQVDLMNEQLNQKGL